MDEGLRSGRRRRLGACLGAFLTICPFTATALWAATPSPRALQLARTIVEADQNHQAPETDSWSRFTRSVTRRIDETLEIKPPSQSTQIDLVIQKEFDGLRDDLFQANVSAMAQTTTERDMQAELAFKDSPLGKAFGQARREIGLEVRAAMASGTAPTDGPKPEKEKLALVKQVIAASGSEPRLREMFRAMPESVLYLRHVNTQTTDPASLKGAEDDLVNLCLAATVHAYMNSLTDDELRGIVAYDAGPVGRRLAARRPQLNRIEAAMSVDAMKRRFVAIVIEVCAAASCTAEQKSALSDDLDKTTSSLTQTLNRMNDDA